MAQKDIKELSPGQVFSQQTLRELEALCVQGEAPACAAACPLHIDMRALCAHAASGDFTKARSILDAASPFSALIAHSCPGHCRSACVIGQIGDPVDMPALERACVSLARRTAQKRLAQKRKDRTVAVLTSSLYGLAVAWELDRRAFPVDVFFADGDPFHALTPYADATPGDLLLEDWNAFLDSGIKVSLTSANVGELSRSYSLVCADASFLPQGACADPDTLFCEREGVFSSRPNVDASGPAHVLMDARMTAVSADRAYQGVALSRDAAREKPYQSRLYVSLSGVAGTFSAGVSPTVSAQEASREASRCIRCECLECVKGCEFLKAYKRHPGTAVREIYNNISIVMGNHTANSLINACAVCGRCREVCPNGLDLGMVCLKARAMMAESGKMPARAHEFALADMEFSMGPEYFVAVNQKGHGKSAWAFFPGCQLAALYPKTLIACRDHLADSLEGGVGVITGCCGVPASWSGRPGLAQEAMEQIEKAWISLSRPVIIAACPTCASVLASPDGFGARVIGIWDVLDEIGSPARLPMEGLKTVIRDACGSRGDPAARRAVRRAAAAAGVAVEEQDFTRTGNLAPCCGFGGLQLFADMETSDRSAAAAAVPGQVSLAYCANCAERIISSGGSAVHLLETFFGPEGDVRGDFSSRRLNRKAVKAALGGASAEPSGPPMRVEYAEGVMEAMTRRMILTGDVERVLAGAASGEPGVLDRSLGLRAASARIGSVTFWVTFEEEDGAFTVHSAYSHRMQTRVMP